MLLLAKPPYLRWALVVIIFVAAVAWEVADRATVPHPFAARAIPRGETVEVDDVEWRQLPGGALPSIDVLGSTAVADIAAGDPLTSSVIGSLPPVPEGWWSVPVALPLGVPPGSKVRLSLIDGTTAHGIVSRAATEDEFGIERAGAVAVSESDVDRVAASSAAGSIVVLVAP